MSSQAITQEDRTCLLTEDKLASRALQGHDLHLTRNSEQLEDIITRGHIIQTPEQDATAVSRITAEGIMVQVRVVKSILKLVSQTFNDKWPRN